MDKTRQGELAVGFFGFFFKDYVFADLVKAMEYAAEALNSSGLNPPTSTAELIELYGTILKEKHTQSGAKNPLPNHPTGFIPGDSED